ncbi:hypothetical protein EC988_004490 [Linderina pennispora]|nr:hypothetical protein EC988_004490 [Linderina pennispora]
MPDTGMVPPPEASDTDESNTTTPTASEISLVSARQKPAYRSSLGRASIDNIPVDVATAHTIIRDEQKRVGLVGLEPYMHYIRACGIRNISMLGCASIAAMCLSVGSSMWLAHWATLNDGDTDDSTRQPLYYLSVYSALGAVQVLSMVVVSAAVWLLCAVNGSKNTHSQLLQCMLRVPTSFFDSTPLGRILGLFSSDQAQIDENLPMFLEIWVMAMLRIAIAMALIVVAMPLSFVFIAPVAYVFIGVQRRFMATSREIRRLVSTGRNSVITCTEEAVHGAMSIRAYGRSAEFEKGCAARNETLMMTWWTHLCTTRWLACRLDLIAATIVLLTNMSLIAALYFVGSLTNGYAGLALTNAIAILGVLNTSVRSFGFVELAMISVERVKDYSRLESEAPEVIEDYRPSESWPEAGTVEFRNYSTRYREGLDLVLKDLSFRVMPNQKVGIVGHTGAGKSSLTLALFRIIEASSGQILLDGHDISKYGLFDVRSRLSIIPQDPVLFAGTIRENLDPFSKYSDEEIWCALDNAHLGDFIRSKDERLEFIVAQNGENFSVGQRQLICLARALLRRAKILVLDEATAAIDNATDAVIQQTIREEFSNCTVLTIAHRLNTVLDSDMILVIDRGRVAEFDSPQNLLRNEDSLFAKLAEEANLAEDE